MGKSTISMAIFNSYVSHYQRVSTIVLLVISWPPLWCQVAPDTSARWPGHPSGPAKVSTGDPQVAEHLRLVNIHVYNTDIHYLYMFVHTSFGIYRNSSGTVGIPCVKKKHRDRTGCSQMEVYSQCVLRPFSSTLMT